ncbi:MULTISPECIES: CDP-glycerol glycerophosphotransferase family protein [unclassified Arthrobacter]|uniref:CDP-glycerol glycerophosphotransferase family protein n=1 Tax=unclassified Arthrobacter TaxID=235627 RepID=UPI002DFE6861|nr:MULTISPECIES: CDP-glycerol glycerophosphotransferase family protein [unclassified Arthrobacter]MEC5190994.1 CDP-glycerol glycerophosphotransferase [Arthrobacter sp. MP_M4]MEC5202165.1 CDP-glycerol glycerophosphotransferase [Arthrobacter sp. MP_M7]
MSPAQDTIEYGLLLEEKMEWNAAVEVYTALMVNPDGNEAELEYRLGHAHFHLSQYEQAVTHLQAAVALQPDKASWHYRLGYVFEKLASFEEAVRAYQSSLALEPGHARRIERLRSASASAERVLAARLEDQVSRGKHHLARVEELTAGKAPLWQLIDALSDGLEFHRDDSAWLIRLADAQFSMNRFVEAGENYAAAAHLKPDQADLHFRAGWCWELTGRHGEAQRAYDRAIATDFVLDARAFGVGVFFQKRGRWVAAADAFKSAIRLNPTSAELQYKLGYALMRSYKWHESIESLRMAVAMDPAVPLWHYRLGFAYERLAEWEDSAHAYEYATTIHETAPSYWYYRLGYVLTQAHEFKRACLAFASTMKSLGAADDKQTHTALSAYEARLLTDSLRAAVKSQSAERCFLAGDRLSLRGMYALAAEAYDAGVKRMEVHSPEAYFRLGSALQKTGDFESACLAYAETRLFKRAHGIDTAAYRKNKELNQSMIYTDYLETLPLIPQTILYEASHGGSVSCNPLQIFRSLIKDPRFTSWTHVWILNDKSRIPIELANKKNVIFASRDSDLYLRYLTTATHLINNNTFPPYFVRREGQKYLNTWHGTPLKTLGKDIKNGFMDHRNAARNFLHSTHMIAPNIFTAKCLIEKYDVEGIFAGAMAVTGYPRIDATVGASQQKKTELRRRLGIRENQKIVLYAPTWRGSLGALEDNGIDIAGVMRQLATLGCAPLYRGHALASSDEVSSDFMVPDDIPTNDLLAIVDVLVTDYSSIFFDFMATGRPIVYFAYDLEEYSSERGMYFELESLPGQVCIDTAELLQGVSKSLEDTLIDDKYRAGIDQFCSVEDGFSTDRAIEFFFFDAQDSVISEIRQPKRNVLFYQGSFIPNGITTSYLNLVSNVDKGYNRLFVAVEPSTVASDERRLEKFSQNPDHVQVLGRVGGQLVTAEERWVIDKFNATGDLASPELWDIYDRAFQREFRRLYGDAKFDAVVCFEGYARYWAALFANTTTLTARKSIYLHNDMHREWRHRFRYLESMFRLYAKFDKLVSVTKSVHEENIRQLSTDFHLPAAKFTYCNNVVNAVEAHQLAAEVLDDDLHDWMSAGSKNFITMGRLSPEKGHAKLINAFAHVVKLNPSCTLTILGDGPLRSELEKLIVDLALESNICLAGLRLNPFPALRKADCFVFSSDYEGQGLVVLEALILGVPVISTDVVGPRSILEDGHGLLVENSVRGLVDGMLQFLNGKMPRTSFNYEDYQVDAIKQFELIALDGQ